MSSKQSKTFLFSIDFEDVRTRVPNGMKYSERIPELTERILKFLSHKKVKTTFFCVGETAAHYPDQIKTIASEGHEIACHSYNHQTLNHLNPESFKYDLEKCLELFDKLGINQLYGYRAPTFSLTEDTKWVYPILQEAGIKYSSSVLPAKSPLFGWPNYNHSNPFQNQIFEIPITLSDSLFTKFPFAGGVYFRLIPFFITKSEFRKKNLITGYCHPYDYDTDQEYFMHPELNNNSIYNYLMFINRKKVFTRLDYLFDKYKTLTYYDYYLLRTEYTEKKDLKCTY